jgi:hypothetical protein
VLLANEILSQAGVNVRIRNPEGTRIDDAQDLLVLTVTSPEFEDTGLFVQTEAEARLLGIKRSATATDLNIYYVKSLVDINILDDEVVGIAIGPDDYYATEITTNTGIVIAKGRPAGTANLDAYRRVPETLAHEIAHVLISPDRPRSVLEHGADGEMNFMHSPRGRAVPTLLSRQQSARINAAGVLLVP